jgi:beta-N-acetylhexosaminidase
VSRPLIGSASRPGPAALAARLTWGALRGTALDTDERARLAPGLGGVVLFERNLESPGQVRTLTRAIRAAAGGPVRIAIDQEGGYVTRIGEPLTRFPGPMAIAATGSVRLARAVAEASGRELRSLGIDTVLAPVLDVAAVLDNPSIGTRAFGDEPGLVRRFGAAMVQGYFDGGVLPIPKHLPGHGRTALDSHVSSPVVAGTVADLVAQDLPPFAAAVRAGAPALMTAHVAYEAFADGLPASLSPDAMALARRQLAFDGLLLTDALVMDAITARAPLEEAGVLAILAGADAAMAIEGHRPLLAGLTEAIERGRLPEARVQEALGRAGALERLALSLSRRVALGPAVDDEAAMSDAHAALAREVAARSITLVAAPGSGSETLGGTGSVLVVDILGGRRSPVDGGPGREAGAGDVLAAAIPGGQALTVAPDDARSHEAVGHAATEAASVVVLTRDAYASPHSMALLAAISDATASSVHVALRNPLDLAGSAAGTRIAAYADTPATIAALAERLTGRAPFQGRLPVRLPELTPLPTESAA